MTGIITIILVYLTSGYFHFWAIAVASGSMSPKIEKGDVVIIEKLDEGEEKNLKKVLLVTTGALFSPTFLFQKQNILSIAHAISLEVQK